MEQRRLSLSRERRFPLLDPENYAVTSVETDEYNCVGWAVNVTDPGLWWPAAEAPEYFWPEVARREETLEAFIEGLGYLGFAICLDERVEPNIEKVVIYALRGVPAHMARQLSDGRWTSKLGEWEDIEHDSLRDLSESIYGLPVLFMSRTVQSSR